MIYNLQRQTIMNSFNNAHVVIWFFSYSVTITKEYIDVFGASQGEVRCFVMHCLESLEIVGGSKI